MADPTPPTSPTDPAAGGGAPAVTRTAPAPGPARTLLVRTAFVLLALATVHPAISPAIALAMGLMLAFIVPTPFPWLTKRGSKIILQCSVALLGFRMEIAEMAREALTGGLFAVATISGTIVLGAILARLLGVARDTATLISGGTAICGGSAIAAIAPAIGARSASMAVAMAIVFVLNGLALFIFPPIGHALDLTPAQFGTWAGIAIHDVSSVVGAAAVFGEEALDTATTVKLARALWIVPLAIAAGWIARRWPAPDGEHDGEPAASRKRPPLIPWFILAFVAASLLRSFVPGVADVAPALGTAAKAGLSLTLFLIGTGLSVRTLREVGPRAFVLGILLWLTISLSSLGVVVSLPG